MVKKIYKYIQEHRMLENTGILVAGLSGGADSVCLVGCFKRNYRKEQLDIRLLAVHVNHGIRGTEAERMSSLRSSFADSYRWNI